MSDTIHTLRVKRKFLTDEQEYNLISILTNGVKRETKDKVKHAIKFKFYSLEGINWKLFKIDGNTVSFHGQKVSEIRNEILKQVDETV